MNEEPRVTLKHLRELRYCAPRIRAWCRENGHQVREFREGIPVSVVRRSSCAFAHRAADLAERQARGDA